MIDVKESSTELLMARHEQLYMLINRELKNGTNDLIEILNIERELTIREGIV